jgi:hypothetical protein
MARKGSKENPITTADLSKARGVLANILQEDRLFNITQAQIKDDFCHYSYEVIQGIGLGDTHNVKGSGIIDDDMRNAFSAFNVHMAVIDDAFKNKGVEIVDIDSMRNHELTGYYHVTGFKIKGSAENESIILLGNKYVSAAGGRMELESPKIPLDNLSSYKWYNELKTAADAARKEVELYKGGKYTAVEAEEQETKYKQTTILDQGGNDNDEGFNDAEV